MTRKAGTKEDLILALWEQCRSEAAGEPELIRIQKALLDNLGLAESPARIARTLADNQVPLRHPEILAADSGWREGQLNKWPDLRQLSFETIENAVDSMKRLEELRRRFLSEGDKAGVQIVVEQTRERRLELLRQSGELAQEFAQWLAIWLQTPEIFDDWRELRLKSPEFQRRFRTEN